MTVITINLVQKFVFSELKIFELRPAPLVRNVEQTKNPRKLMLILTLTKK